MRGMNTERAPDSLPMLHLREIAEDHVRLVAILVRRKGATPPILEADGKRIEAEALRTEAGATLWRYAFTLPRAARTQYRVEGRDYQVATDFRGDMSIAFVSCNGQEHGDLDRPVASRNALWRQLAERNAREPIQLLLQGGDQIYADEVTEAHPLSRDWPDVPHRELGDDEIAELRAALGKAFFLRYATQAAQGGFSEVSARIPTLAMWDDHDICDGWGSLRPASLDSQVGRCLFEAAREAFLLFQMGHAPSERPEIAMGEGHLSWRVTAPGFSIVAPDLRSTRRPERVMDDRTWADMERVMGELPTGHTFIMSSVPALGPRLSLVERAMKITRRMEKYEDDLRDQWQSFAHREEWQRFLRLLLDRHEDPDAPVTVLSGEIHLATRAIMDAPAGPLHQLVASGITHPAPPRLYARGLGTLARFGETPLKGHPIRLRALPGQRAIYAAQRNYLMLHRRDGGWSAEWMLEKSGRTPALPL
ncbi:alkaline phosphatase D family protein [Palleronia sp. LCG004]|uniref:alkaline phosphatase D family protein n=1 Tax=Palleronia sp. LCG004 TaxID=3079304 RepID=UPI0029420702|nr:alkaline phosphatase D family protein [Palleronia sp. LCG004]WOI56323.1 alkaline phosphatase D family protein [Palleronia sp. LCG004]